MCSYGRDFVSRKQIIIKNRIEETDFGDFEYKNYEELKETKTTKAGLTAEENRAFPTEKAIWSLRKMYNGF